ncbi:exodeoxyribonuclease VII large subunit [Dyadobacter sp. CY312]|uniref:exodeoxyribonuclease VII large subunit n=1 Tax=Dyadobacter sp. CY312 TaxID=2907303 RepID=UPI001F36017E|nr:exodeoxyribonuclease VII large subunit [Dyadobacter sp. CY312]MCE7044445.1 hypothetical protein [Dyadobacter sp. CY312]
MEKEITAISQTTIVIGPSDLLAQYRNSLQSRFDGMPVSVGGYYVPSIGDGLKGFHYDGLIDENRKEKLVIVISSEQRAKLKKDGFYTFIGTLEKGSMTNDGQLRLRMRVLELIGHDKTKRQFSAANYDLFKERIDRGFMNITNLLVKKLSKNERPDIVIIKGSGSIVDHDFADALGEADRKYDISWITPNLMSEKEIIDAVYKIDKQKCSLLVFMRGGGTGLEIFDSMELGEKVLESGLHFITAIGHKVEEPLLAKLSDRAFPTPTHFGKFLNELVQDIRKYQKELDDKKLSLALTRNELEAREEEIVTMRKSMAQQQTKNQHYVKTLLLTIAGVVLLLIVALWLK